MACSSKGVIDVDSDTSGSSEFLPSEVSESEEPARAAAVIGETPAPAAISRSRVLSKNTSLKPVAVRGEKKLKNKSILERVGEFRGQCLERRDGELFCGVWLEVLSQKKSSVKKHVDSKKHNHSVAKRKAEHKKQLCVSEALQKCDEQRLKGESLPMKQRVYRMQVTEHFLKAGLPLSKVDDLRPVLEQKFRLTSQTHLRKLIPTILEQEQQRLASEIKGRAISIVFDGTTRLGEAIAIIVRFLDDEWCIQQRLIRLRTVAKAVNAPQLAQVINECLATQFQHPAELLVAMMRDGASVNTAAIRALSVFYPNVLDVVCASHILNNAGQHFDFPLLQEFTRLWISLFAHSARVKLAWKARTGKAMRSHSETWWWSKWEILHQVSLYFGDVVPFLEDNQDVSANTTQQLFAILQDPVQLSTLRLQLAATVDAGKYFVSATYVLEGDGPLIFECHSHLQAVATAMDQKDFCSLKAVAREIAATDDNQTAQQLVQQTLAGLQPAILWFLRKFNQVLQNQVTAFRRARFFDPVEVQSLALTPEKVRSLECFPFFNGGELELLVAELPHYLAAVADVTLNNADDKLRWWSRQNTLPHWKNAVKKLVLVQPSCAAAERAFSIMASCFTDEQQSTLEETVEASVMLRYNVRKL